MPLPHRAFSGGSAEPDDTVVQIKAEKLVLAANGVHRLATVALRPSGIFGEWDKLLVPVLVRNAKRGKMKYIIGNGRNLMEFTYAGNVADAHLLVSCFGCATTLARLAARFTMSQRNCCTLLSSEV